MSRENEQAVVESSCPRSVSQSEQLWSSIYDSGSVSQQPSSVNIKCSVCQPCCRICSFEGGRVGELGA